MKRQAITLDNLLVYRSEVVLLLAVLLFSLFISKSVLAHGGKHQDESFTRLQAAQKAIELYDRLVAQEKLEPTWETELEEIEVSIRMKENRRETVVSFQRDHGDPSTVFIFFDADGNYAGSNFTGK